MQVKVDRNLCDECGLCLRLSNLFSVDIDGSIIVVGDVDKSEENNIEEIAERCPINAIRIIK